jgi:dihydroflavonol-4-reductase
VRNATFITGGTGLLGAAILRRLLADGRRVKALARSAVSAKRLEDMGAQPVQGNILQPDGLEAAMSGCDVVFHVAGGNAFCLPDPSSLYRMNVTGSGNVVWAAARAGVVRVVYTSSAATLGEPKGTVGTEASPHRGSFLSDYERSKYLAEEIVWEIARDEGIDVISVNPSSVQGPGRTKGTGRILLNFVNGKLSAAVNTRMSLIDIADCTEGHVLADARGQAGERYVLSGATLTVREALDIIGSVTGLSERPRMLPPFLAMAGATVVETIAKVRRRHPPVCREMVRTLLHGHAYDGSKAARELGLGYTPIEETLRRTVAWYVEQGLVTRHLPMMRPAPG